MALDLDLLIVIIYLTATLVIGFRYAVNINTLSDYAVGSRNYHNIVIVATIFATMVGGFGTMGVVAEVHKLGICFLGYLIFSFIRKLIMAYLIPLNWKYFENCISPGDIIQSFYGNKPKFIAGIVAFISIAGGVSTQVIILGYLFEYMFNIDNTISMIISTLIIILYSSFGGIKSVTTTDLFQFGVLIIGIPLVAAEAFRVIGGYNNFITQIPATHLNLFAEDKSFYLYMLPLFIVNTIPFFPEMAQRILISRNAKQFKQTMLTVVAVEIFFYTVIVCIGLMGVILYPEAQSQDILLVMIKNILPVGFKGLVISGLFAVVMSTTDSMLNTASLTFSHDILYPIMGEKKKINYLIVAQLCTFILGIAAILIAILFGDLISIIVNVAILWHAIIAVPLFMALLGARISENQFVIVSMISFIALITGHIYLKDSFVSPTLLSMFCGFTTYWFIYFINRFTKLPSKA